MASPPRILLGVTGGIAACKAPFVVRALTERGCEVRCALTRAGGSFVAPLALEVLSGAALFDASYLAPGTAGRELHIDAARWADVVCVAPATANFLGKLARGLADDFLSTMLLAFEGPVLVAPAMHETMWRQESVQGNLATLETRGVQTIGPETGRLASGEWGVGRMSEPETIAAAVLERFADARRLAGKRVLVSAGPTREALDPVRFLSNPSSGRMGFAMAAACAELGADVTVVAGPTELPVRGRVRRIDVVTAAEMGEAMARESAGVDCIIMAAAVADYRPRAVAVQKIKKTDAGLEIQLERTEDILSGLRDLAPEAVLVGFAAETEALLQRAREKLERKRLDFIVANDVARSDSGFASSENEVTLLARDGESVAWPKMDKRVLARLLVRQVAERVADSAPATEEGGDVVRLPG